jgi:predicted RNA binding protein YcfA (HicA-like mRNA interferase family)
VPPLPVISGAECISALQRVGYVTIRQRGSHVRLICEGRSPVTVPLHRELDRGTLRSIIRIADLTVEEFLAYLAV